MRMPRVLEFPELHQPDIVVLWETKAEPDAFPLLEVEAAGYRAVHHSAGRWAGGIDRNFRKGQKPSDNAPLLLELRD
jgi:exonuclease III